MRKLILAAAALTLFAAPAFAATEAKPKAERHYDCSKKGNANKAECKAAAATAATPATPATSAAPAAKADAKPKAERHYDCTKKGNANKAECKAAAPAAAPAAPATPAKPATPAAPAAKPAAAPAPAVAAKADPSGKTRSPAQLANDNKMKACGEQWGKMTEAQKADWKARGEKLKDKNGKPYTGWIAFSIECRKKA